MLKYTWKRSLSLVNACLALVFRLTVPTWLLSGSSSLFLGQWFHMWHYCIIHSPPFLLVPQENFTWRLYNVVSTSMQRHDVASTLRRRYIYVMCLLRCFVSLTVIFWVSTYILVSFWTIMTRQISTDYRYLQCMQNMIFHTMSFP